MSRLSQLSGTLAEKIGSLISRTESEHPGMKEVAAMVYVGDIVVLREQRHRRRSDGWGSAQYNCDSTGCQKLP